MHTIRIINQNDPWYASFHAFYVTSFPLHEQRNEAQQIRAFADERYHLDCYIRDERLVAFIAYWDFGTYLYIEHFAVHPAYRGQSIGSEVLSGFMAANDALVLLEIDPVVDEISAKRLQFYRHLGFVENPWEHVHPAYDKRFSPHRLTILTAPRAITQEAYNRFYNDLIRIVM